MDEAGDDELQVEGALLAWLATFPGVGNSSHAESGDALRDGVALTMVGASLSSEFFDIESVQRAQDGNDIKANWMLCMSNLKVYVAALEDFCCGDAGADISDISEYLDTLDLAAIAKGEDADGMMRLVEILLVASVHCSGKEKHVQEIMRMSGDHQVQLMHIISDLSHIFAGANAPAASPPLSPTASIASGRNARADSWAMDDSNDGDVVDEDSDAKVEMLQREIRALKLENSELRARTDAATETANSSKQDANSAADAAVSRAIKRAERAEEQAAEFGREMEGRIDSLELELSEAQLKHQGNERRSAERLRAVTDELEIFKSKEAAMNKVQASLDRAKLKLEELASIKKKNQELEEQNDDYLQKMLDLESQVSTIGTLKKKLSVYKDEVVDLQAAAAGTKAQLAKKDKTIKALESNAEKFQSEKDLLQKRLQSTADELEALRESDAAVAESSTTFSASSLEDTVMGSDSSLKERVLRLQRANEELKAKLASAEPSALASGTATSDLQRNGDDADAEILREQLDDEKRIRHRFEEEAIESRLKIAELESQLAGGTTEASNPSKMLEKEKEKQSEMEKEIEKARADLLSKDTQISSLQERITALEVESNNGDGGSDEQAAIITSVKQQLKEKESLCDQLQLDKEKLENYVRQVVQTQGMKYKIAVKSLQSQITEKDGQIKHLQTKIDFVTQAREKMQQQHKREERLIMSALYEVGQKMQRRIVTNPSSVPTTSAQRGTPPISWLSKQRQQRSTEKALR
eukprot:g4187.t1